MEFEVLLAGIGGQGIQLISKTLAQAATAQGKHAMLAAEYGGEMRGGPSQSTVVVGDAPLRALPVVPAYASAIVANHKFSGVVPQRLRPGGLLVLNSSVVDSGQTGTEHQVVDVAAMELARTAGAPQAAGFVLLGAFNALTGLVEHDSLAEAMESLLPPYRKEHAKSNAVALDAGAQAIAEQRATVLA